MLSKHPLTFVKYLSRLNTPKADILCCRDDYKKGKKTKRNVSTGEPRFLNIRINNYRAKRKIASVWMALYFQIIAKFPNRPEILKWSRQTSNISIIIHIIFALYSAGHGFIRRASSVWNAKNVRLFPISFVGIMIEGNPSSLPLSMSPYLDVFRMSAIFLMNETRSQFILTFCSPVYKLDSWEE